MKRRDFIFKSMTRLGLGIGLTASSTSWGAILHLSRNFFKTTQLKSGDIFFATAKGLALMPNNPQHGDQIFVVGDVNSVMDPCRLTTIDATIEKNEFLIIDSFANFKLTYDAKLRNWYVS